MIRKPGIFKFFCGPVDWKARQTTLTTSTTEAELLALSHAGSAFIWWERFFDQLGFELNSNEPLTVLCDNSMTVDHIMVEKPKLNTKLQHVDIRHHWLRQYVHQMKTSQSNGFLQQKCPQTVL
jgi:hypothetical protein